MTANEIHDTILLNNFVSDMQHCKHLATAYQFLKRERLNITKVGFAARNITLLYGRHTESKREHGEWVTNVLNEGTPIIANKIKVTTQTGTYNFTVPIENDFYREICDLLQLPCTIAPKQDAKPLNSFKIDSYVLAAIKKAAKFTSDDDLRPAMQCICLHFENNTCEVVATNAHYLYTSKLLVCSQQNKRFEILISPESIKKVCDIKTKDETVLLSILKDNQVIINDVTFNVLATKFPDYKCVIAHYETKMQFDRERLIACIKICEPFANKFTKQINFHLNGKIELQAQDVDFSFERQTSLPYVSKDFPDMDIAFNGTMLRTCLSIFKESEIEMHSNGNSSRMAIFTNGSDKACIMPLMLNS